MRDLAILIAVAMGEPRAAATARIDAAFPELVPPAPPAGAALIGRRSERRGNERIVTELRADGSEREVSRKPEAG